MSESETFKKHKIVVYAIPCKDCDSVYIESETFKKHKIVDVIPCKDCGSVYIGERGRSMEIRLKKRISTFKRRNLNSKIVQHSLETDHIPLFSNACILK